MPESLVLDGLALNDAAGDYVLRRLSMPPPKKKLEWVQSDDSDGGLLLRDPLFENREIEATIRVAQQVTMDAALAKIAAIQAKFEEAERQRDGLPLVWTPNGSTKSYTLYVLTGEIVDLPIDRTGDGRGWFLRYPLFGLRMTARPFGYGAEVGTLLDTFATDTLGNYTFDAGGGTLSVAGGQLVPSSAAHKQAYHSAKGQLYDQQVTLKYTTGASVAGNAGVLAKRLDGTNYLFARTLSDGTNATLTLFVNNNDDFALSSQVAITNLAANTSYWIRIRVEGNKVTAEHWTSAPTPGASPAATRTLTLTGANATKFGEGVKSYAGLKTTPAGTDWRYDDFEVAPNMWQSSEPLLTGVVYGVEGDVPAEGRLIVTDNASRARRHVEWGLEQRYFDPAAALLLDSDSLVTTGFAGSQVTLANAYDPNGDASDAIRATLATQATGVCGTGNQPHVGVYRVKTRARADSLDVRLRLAWAVGDGPLTRNAYVAAPVSGALCEVDLGVIRVPEKRLGSQRWHGRIEAYTKTAGEFLYVDYIELIPAGEGYGKARASFAYTPGLLDARDEFTGTTAAGALNARAAPQGGSWATSGSATDFTFADAPNAGDETITRATTSETGSGRFAILGPSKTDMEVGVRLQDNYSGTSGAIRFGVIARWIDASNYLSAVLIHSADALLQMLVTKTVAGTATTLLNTRLDYLLSGLRYLRLIVWASGNFVVQVLDSAGALKDTLFGSDDALATGGALASGQGGIRDFNPLSTAITRYYDEFYVATPEAEPIAIHAGQSLEVRAAGEHVCLREDPTGVWWGPPPAYRGSRFYLPEAGDDNRPSRVAVKARRRDLEGDYDETLTSGVYSATIAQALHTPRYLAVPH